MDRFGLFLIFFFTATFFGGFLLLTQEAQAQYGSSCSEYGVMAYEDYSGSCKCMSGYVFQDSYMGKQCVSADSVCHDDYGIMSRYNSLSNSCECSYGYSLGKNSIGETQCISDTQACQNQLGFNSTALGGQCKCSYGYVIDTNMFGDQQCTDGDQVCHSDHGYNSSYNSLSNKCECDDDYTFDDSNQCVKKQHNVYFKVLDINPEDDRNLLIKSDYDYSKYIVSLGIGCLSSTISRYEGKNLVVNLGTDYDLDMFDTVVLQDDDQTCSIVSRQRTYDDSFPEPEEATYHYTPPVQTNTPPAVVSKPTYVPESVKPVSETPAIEATDTGKEVIGIETQTNNVSSTIKNISTSTQRAVETDIQKPAPVEKESIFKKIFSFFKNLFH